MPRRISPSQARALIRQAEQKQRRAVNDYNNQVRKVKRAVDDHNREARAHNARVRSNRQRLQRELQRLSTRRTSTRFVTYRTSVQVLQESFTRVETASEYVDWPIDDELFDMAEGEVANSAAVFNALLDEPTDDAGDLARLQDTIITDELLYLSPDLDARWKGALFALSPVNPDAARQFCTSAREIFVKILDSSAPDDVVLAADPEAPLTQHGQVQRRAKIDFCLSRAGKASEVFTDFVDDDVNEVMELFGTFNPATHGNAGKYDFAQLSVLKHRVEHAIQFLYRVVTA